VSARDFVAIMRADVARLRARRDERRARSGSGERAEAANADASTAPRFKMDFKTGKPELPAKTNGSNNVNNKSNNSNNGDDDEEMQTLRAREAKLSTYVVALEKMRTHLDKTMAALVDKRFAAFDNVYFRLLEFQHTLFGEAATLSAQLRPSVVAFRANTPLAAGKPARAADAPICIDGNTDDDDLVESGKTTGHEDSGEGDDDDEEEDNDDDDDDDDDGDGGYGFPAEVARFLEEEAAEQAKYDESEEDDEDDGRDGAAAAGGGGGGGGDDDVAAAHPFFRNKMRRKKSTTDPTIEVAVAARSIRADTTEDIKALSLDPMLDPDIAAALSVLDAR
jgi:hypothetical protein